MKLLWFHPMPYPELPDDFREAERFADRIGGPMEIRSIAGSGHTAEIDAPDATADAILSFLS